jgi:hypothetical protein
MSKVANNNGDLVEQEPIILDASLFYNFVMEHSEYFEVDSHSMQWCVEWILERGKAEIRRQIKTATKQKENKVFGDLARATAAKYKMTFEEAQIAIRQFVEEHKMQNK